MKRPNEYQNLIHSSNGRDSGALLLVQSVVVDRSVLDIGLALLLIKVGHSVLHPVLVVTVGVVLVRVGTTALLALLGTVHGGGGIAQKIAQLESLDEVGVPDQRLVGNLDVVELLHDLVNLALALGKELGGTVDGGMLLHDGLHLATDLGGGGGALGVSELVEVGDGFHAGIGTGVGDGIAGLGNVGDAEGAGAAKDDNVQQGVGAQTVGTVDGGTGGLTGGEETGHNLIVNKVARGIKLGTDDLTVVVGGDTTHVVMHGGQYRDGFLGHIDTGKDGSSLTDTGQPFGEEVGGQVVQMQVDVILLGTDAPSLPNFHRHGPTNDVATGQILGTGRVPFHEPLALGVAEDATLSTTTLGDETAGTVDAGGVELDELGVLIGQAGAHGHGIAISGAGVGGRAGEVGPAVSAGGQDGVLGVDAMDGAVLHVEGGDAGALSIVGHDEVEGEVLDEVGGVKGQRAAIQGVKHGMTGAVGGTGAAMGLAALAVVEGLSTKGTLVDLAVLGTAERETELLQFQNGRGGLPAHVVDGILIAEPIRALDGVVHVPSPVVLGHVAQGGVHSALGGDRVGAGGKQFGYAGGFETGLRQPHGRAESGTAGADDDGVEFVIDNGVVSLYLLGGSGEGSAGALRGSGGPLHPVTERSQCVRGEHFSKFGKDRIKSNRGVVFDQQSQLTAL